jgi:hypothetical protein
MGALAYGKKLFSIALIFNCLVTITYAVGLLSGFYKYGYLLFTPYVDNSNLFWLVIIISVFNIFPCAYIGQTVKTGRLWFHHYFWGFLVMVAALVYIVIAIPSKLPILFTENLPELDVNVGRFFLLAGLALVLDDLPDVSRITERFICFLKARAHQGKSVLHYTELALGLVSLYFFVAVTAYLVMNPVWATPANLILSGTLLVTCLTCFWTVKRKVWLNLYNNHCQH